jgi:hypothetical protein
MGPKHSPGPNRTLSGSKSPCCSALFPTRLFATRVRERLFNNMEQKLSQRVGRVQCNEVGGRT